MKNEEQTEARVTPWWETAAMIASFALLWAFLLARHAALQAAARSGAATPRLEMSPLWTVAQFVAIGLLLFVMVRRMKRTRDAMREATQIKPGFPIGFAPRQPHTGGHGKNGAAPKNISKKKNDS
jgi:H+/Cl- antiporter ClcA